MRSVIKADKTLQIACAAVFGKAATTVRVSQLLRQRRRGGGETEDKRNSRSGKGIKRKCSSFGIRLIKR